MKKNTLTIILVLALFANCNRNNANKDSFKDYIITINLDSIGSLSSLIDSTYFVFLESSDENSLLSSASLVKFYNKNIFILDSFTKSINAFSENGNFINKISNIGKGPGEYITPFDFEIKNEQHFLYCADLYKIITMILRVILYRNLN